MLSNGRPLLDLVRKAKIERPRFRRGVARSLQHLMFLLSCGVTVSPPVPEALFLSAEAARSSHRAGGGGPLPV